MVENRDSTCCANEYANSKRALRRPLCHLLVVSGQKSLTSPTVLMKRRSSSHQAHTLIQAGSSLSNPESYSDNTFLSRVQHQSRLKLARLHQGPLAGGLACGLRHLMYRLAVVPRERMREDEPTPFKKSRNAQMNKKLRFSNVSNYTEMRAT